MNATKDLVRLSDDEPVWERFFHVHPLVLVGTVEPDGSHDLAPKHMAMPLGWDNWFGFICTERHGTYRNAVRTGVFTVSYPAPDQILHATLAASPRFGEQKPALAPLPVFPATEVEGVLVEGCPVYLECTLDRVVPFGQNSLIVGKVVAALVRVDALRSEDRDDADILVGNPVLAYVYPGRFARISRTDGFPFPSGFSR